MNDDPRCCGSGMCIIDPAGRCWCGQQWDGQKMAAPSLSASPLSCAPAAGAPAADPSRTPAADRVSPSSSH